MAIDLHVHSTFSDGTNTPQELVSLANKIGLSAMALTDHDTCEGVPFARDAAKGTPLKVIPGIELSTEYHHTEVHIVGLNIDPDNRELLEATREFRHKREHRNELMIELLRQQGFSITMEELIADNPDAVITRANIARFLVDHGEIGSVNHAFERYLGDDCSCYVPREKIPPCQSLHPDSTGRRYSNSGSSGALPYEKSTAGAADTRADSIRIKGDGGILFHLRQRSDKGHEKPCG